MPEPLRILLVEDQEDAAVLVQRTLARVESQTIQVQWANNLANALRMLEAASFDAILLDLNLPDSMGIQTFKKIRQQRGESALIVWTALEDAEMALEAVREGADDYLTKADMPGASLARHIRLVVERRKSRGGAASVSPAALPGAEPQRPATVLGFIGAKGGVGTTTVALNLAVAFSRLNKRTIAVELRPDYGVFSFHLKRTPTNNLSALSALAPKDIDVAAVESRLANFPLGLRVLFGPQRPEEFKPIAPEATEALIRTLSGMAECIVIDLPPVVCPMAQAALRQCHFVAIVVECDPVSAHAGRVLQETLQAWDIRNDARGAIIVSKNPTGNANESTPSDIGAEIECPIVGVIPPAAELCARANHAGVPILVLEPESMYSTTILDMARRLTAETVVPVAGEEARARAQRDLENWFW
ncbi:MAG: response regulator [Bryobacteraceae bacterium]